MPSSDEAHQDHHRHNAAPTPKIYPEPPTDYHHHHHHHSQPHLHPEQAPSQPSPQTVAYGPGVVPVAPLEFAPQPWVYDFLRFLAKHTTGIARVDLRRPTLPPPDTLGDNVFFTKGATSGRNRGRPTGQFIRQDRQYGADPFGRPIPLEPPPPSYQPAPTPRSQPTGARLKITRHVSLFPDSNGGKPLLDLGLGLGFDMDSQRLLPVARLKVKDWLSVKAVPLGAIRAGKSFRIGEKLALKVAYEVPISCAVRPLAPPARLMVRLDNFAGAGLHLSPAGVEFDQRVIGLGNSVTLRAAGSLIFPRQLPLDPDREESFFGWKIHRLGLKAGW